MRSVADKPARWCVEGNIWKKKGKGNAGRSSTSAARSPSEDSDAPRAWGPFAEASDRDRAEREAAPRSAGAASSSGGPLGLLDDKTDDEKDYVETDKFTPDFRHVRHRARKFETGKFKNQCDECGLYYMYSGALILADDPGFDWQGHLPIRCFRCVQLQGPTGRAMTAEYEHDIREGGDLRSPLPR